MNKIIYVYKLELDKVKNVNRTVEFNLNLFLIKWNGGVRK